MYVVLKVQNLYSSIAQSVEHAAVNRDVVGSSPTRGVFLNIRLRGQALDRLVTVSSMCCHTSTTALSTL